MNFSCDSKSQDNKKLSLGRILERAILVWKGEECRINKDGIVEKYKV
jgi:hypothetical protein